MNFVIIGCGVISATHVSALKQLEDQCLYGVCDIVPEKADALAAKEGVEHVYYDYHDVLKDPNVDIVNVCVPSGIHGEICIAAARAGKHIVCEKPLEITPERIQAVVDAVDESGIKMQCIFQRRMMPVAKEVKRLVSEGALGKIVLADAYLKYYRDQAYYNSADWRATWDLDGGGALMNQGVHGIDLIMWMLSDEPARVFGRAETLARDIVVEDTATAMIKTKKGTQVVIEGTTSVYPPQPSIFAIQGTKGSIIFSDNGIETWSFLDEENAPPRPGEGGDSVVDTKNHAILSYMGHAELLQDLVEAIQEDRETMIPPRDGANAVKLITTIYRSSQEGREIVFD